MDDAPYIRSDTVVIRRGRTDWGAIWAGAFTFAAIWSIFGVLGFAIFSSAASTNGQRAAGSLGVGMAIWAIVLTIIAMYVAGRETGHLAAVTNRHDGLVHGMIMFGLSVVATLVITLLGGMSLSGSTGTVVTGPISYLMHVFSGMGWVGFLSLILGWLAAMGGASTGVTASVHSKSADVREMKPAA
jgi:hypothetical protein